MRLTPVHDDGPGEPGFQWGPRRKDVYADRLTVASAACEEKMEDDDEMSSGDEFEEDWESDDDFVDEKPKATAKARQQHRQR